jgi:hypothetical protein
MAATHDCFRGFHQHDEGRHKLCRPFAYVSEQKTGVNRNSKTGVRPSILRYSRAANLILSDLKLRVFMSTLRGADQVVQAE